MSVDKPQQGEPLKISARLLGQAYEAGEDFARRRRMGASQPPAPRGWNQCIVQVKNDSGADRIAGDALEIGASLLTTLDDRHLWFGAAKRSGNGVCGVLTEPIKSGEIGPMCVSGVVLAYVDVGDEDHTHCYLPDNASMFQSDFGGTAQIIQKPGGTGSKWCAVLLGVQQDIVRRGKAAASIADGASGNCNLWIDGAVKGTVTGYNDWNTSGALASGDELRLHWLHDRNRWEVMRAGAGASGTTTPFLWLTNFGRLLASGSGSPGANEVSAARYGAIYFQSVYNDPAAAEIEILTESAATVDDCALRITADGLYKITARFTGVDNTSYVDEDYMYDTGTVDGIDTWHHATPNSTISRKDTDDNWTALTSIVGHRNIFGGYASSAGSPPASSLTQVSYADDWLQGYGEIFANLNNGDELWFGMGYLASTYIASTAVKFAINSYDVEIVRIGSQVTPTSYTL